MVVIDLGYLRLTKSTCACAHMLKWSNDKRKKYRSFTASIVSWWQYESTWMVFSESLCFGLHSVPSSTLSHRRASSFDGAFFRSWIEGEFYFGWQLVPSSPLSHRDDGASDALWRCLRLRSVTEGHCPSMGLFFDWEWKVNFTSVYTRCLRLRSVTEMMVLRMRSDGAFVYAQSPKGIVLRWGFF